MQPIVFERIHTFKLSNSILQATSVAYQGLSRVTTDAEGKISTQVTDPNGWLRQSIDHHSYYQNFTYSYDANGNAITRNGNSISWSSYNYPTQLNGPGETINLYYDANRQRYKQVYTNNGNTETTLYVGGLLEKVTANGTDDYRYSIYGNNQVVAIMSRTTAGTNVTRYALSDYQGSVAKFGVILTSAIVGTAITHAACWAHVRRKFDEAVKTAANKDNHAKAALGFIGQLYQGTCRRYRIPITCLP